MDAFGRVFCARAVSSPDIESMESWTFSSTSIPLLEVWRLKGRRLPDAWIPPRDEKRRLPEPSN